MSTNAGLIGRWNGRVSWWLARVAAFALAALAVVTFCDVIARYFFASPFTFTVDFTELAMGVIVYFGVGLTTHDNDHISVDFVTLRLPDRIRALLALITNTLAFLYLIFLVWRLWLRAATLYDKNDITPITLTPLWPFAVLMAFGSIFLLTGVLVHMIDAGRRFKNPQEPAPSTSIERSYRE
jgi:TRAP-type transport system small permease protein